MIGKLIGKVDLIREDYLILEVSGVGYQVFANEVVLGHLAKQREAELFIHTNVREDNITLYGFETLEELELFKLLLNVSGVGPKAALAILNVGSPSVIKNAILKEDISVLTQVSGVGKKTAERIIIDLQNKIEVLPIPEQEAAQSGQEVMEALMSMGYSVAEAREGLKSIPKEVKDEAEKIKLALKAMQTGRNYQK